MKALQKAANGTRKSMTRCVVSATLLANTVSLDFEDTFTRILLLFILVILLLPFSLARSFANFWENAMSLRQIVWHFIETVYDLSF